MGRRGAITCASLLVVLLAGLATSTYVSTQQAVPSQPRRKLLYAPEEEPDAQAWGRANPLESGAVANGEPLDPAALRGAAPGDEDLVFGDDAQPSRARPRPGGKRRRRKRPRRPLPAEPLEDDEAAAASDAYLPRIRPRPPYEDEAELPPLPRPRRRKLRRKLPPADQEPGRYHSRYREEEEDAAEPQPRRRNRLRRPEGTDGAEFNSPAYEDDNGGKVSPRRRPVHQLHARIPGIGSIPIDRVPLGINGDGIPLLEAGSPLITHDNDEAAFLPKPRRRNRIRNQNSQVFFRPEETGESDVANDRVKEAVNDERFTQHQHSEIRPNIEENAQITTVVDDRKPFLDTISPATEHYIPRLQAEVATSLFSQEEEAVKRGNSERIPPKQSSEENHQDAFPLLQNYRDHSRGSFKGTDLTNPVERNSATTVSTKPPANNIDKMKTEKDVVQTVSTTQETTKKVTTSTTDVADILSTRKVHIQPEPESTLAAFPISLTELLQMQNITLSDVVKANMQTQPVSTSIRDKLQSSQGQRKTPIRRLPSPTELFARKKGTHQQVTTYSPSITSNSASHTTPVTISYMKSSTYLAPLMSTSSAAADVNRTTNKELKQSPMVNNTNKSIVKIITDTNVTAIHESDLTSMNNTPISTPHTLVVKLSPAEERTATSRPIVDINLENISLSHTDEKQADNLSLAQIPLMMQESPAIDPVKAIGEARSETLGSSSKSRVVIMPSSITPLMSATESDSEDSLDEDILELLRTQAGSARLAKILLSRNMTLQELIEHRERGSSHQHLSDIFGGKKRQQIQLPSLKTQKPDQEGPMKISMADTSRNPRIMTGVKQASTLQQAGGKLNGEDSVNTALHHGVLINDSEEPKHRPHTQKVGFRFPDAAENILSQSSHSAVPPSISIQQALPKPEIPGHYSHGSISIVDLDLDKQHVLQPVKPNGFFVAEVTEESNDIQEQPVTSGASGQSSKRINTIYNIRPNAINLPELESVFIHQLTQQSSTKQGENSQKTNWRIHENELTNGNYPVSTVIRKEAVDIPVQQTAKPEVEIVTMDDGDETAAVMEEDNTHGIGTESTGSTWLSSAARSAVTAGGTVLGAALLVFLAVLVGCRVRQRRRRMCARSAAALDRSGSETLAAKRSLGGTLVLPGRKRKRQDGGQQQYFEDDFADPPRRYYLWRTIRKTLQYK